jgi:hypothetical protein
MAEQETGGGRPVAGFADSILNAVRDMATRYIDANATFAKQILDFQAQSTSWAKEIPLDPIFQSQYSFNQGLIEFWQDTARLPAASSAFPAERGSAKSARPAVGELKFRCFPNRSIWKRAERPCVEGRLC